MAKKILVIDDEETIIKSIALLLKRNGFKVCCAKSGQEALVMVEKENFDFIISDIRMPGLSGYDAVKGIYKILERKKIKRPPVIFITGYANEECEEEARALNPVDYIYKPFEISHLVGQIKQILN